MKAVERVQGVSIQPSDRGRTHLHNDIHGLLVFHLGFPKGPHVEGADPEGQGAVDAEEEEQGGQQSRHPGTAAGFSAQREDSTVCSAGSQPPPQATSSHSADLYIRPTDNRNYWIPCCYFHFSEELKNMGFIP